MYGNAAVGLGTCRGILITDQITDHYAPYCYELRTTAINEIRVLAECWRMGYQHNSLRLRHQALD
jgi:hypothetical protein